MRAAMIGHRRRLAYESTAGPNSSTGVTQAQQWVSDWFRPRQMILRRGGWGSRGTISGTKRYTRRRSPMSSPMKRRQSVLWILSLGLFASPAVADTCPRQPGVDAINYAFRLTLRD